MPCEKAPGQRIAMLFNLISLPCDFQNLLWSLTTRTIAAMAKPFRCLLRLHTWEYRENPDTHEYYQVCLRCNAYRDKGNSAFDGRGAWGLGG